MKKLLINTLILTVLWFFLDNQVIAGTQIQVGSIKDFYIHIPENKIQATCIAIGKNVYLYVENSVKNLITDLEAAEIVTEFHEKIYPKIHQWIGEEPRPGLDRDSRFTLLLHDVGNNKSARDYGGYFHRQIRTHWIQIVIGAKFFLWISTLTDNVGKGHSIRA